jgi:hypothetical protein
VNLRIKLSPWSRKGPLDGEITPSDELRQRAGRGS